MYGNIFTTVFLSFFLLSFLILHSVLISIILIHHCHGRMSISGIPYQRNVSAKGTLAGLIDVDSFLISLHYTLRILQVLPSRSPACVSLDIAKGSLMSSFVTLQLQAADVYTCCSQQTWYSLTHTRIFFIIIISKYIRMRVPNFDKRNVEYLNREEVCISSSIVKTIKYTEF